MTTRRHPRAAAALCAFLAVTWTHLGSASAIWTSDVKPFYVLGPTWSPGALYVPEAEWTHIPGETRTTSPANFEVWVRAKIWIMFGEPIVVCDAAYRIGGATPPGIRPRTIVLSLPPPFPTTTGERILCDAGILAGPVTGRAPTEAHFSFTVPSAPDWTRLATPLNLGRTPVRTDPRGAAKLLDMQRRAPNVDASRWRAEYAKLCPSPTTRAQYRGWECAGLHTLVWAGWLPTRSRNGRGHLGIYMDMDPTDYNLSLARDYQRRREAEARAAAAALEKKDIERRQRAEAEAAKRKDFWNTPTDPRTVQGSRRDDSTVQAARDRVREAGNLVASLQRAANANASRQSQRRHDLAQRRGHLVCNLIGGHHRGGRCRHPSIEASGHVRHRRATLRVVDFNSAQDDYYDIHVNGVMVGKAHNAPGATTALTVELLPGDNLIELQLVQKRGDGTKLRLEMDPGGFQTVFTGSKNHRFLINAP